MSQTAPSVTDPTPSTTAGSLAGVACISAALLMTELALTRIFSVTMYYHFAFLAISIALFGLGASGVYVYLARRPLGRVAPARLLAWHALAYALVTTLSLALLVRLRVGLNYSLENLLLMLAIYALAALPFFAGGAVISLAISRLSGRINLVYAADLLGASAGCLLLLPLLDRVGAPGVVLATAALGAIAAVRVRAGRRARPRGAAGRSAGRRALGRARVRPRVLRRHGHQGPRRRHGAVQQVELVLADRGLRPPSRRLVAERDLHGRDARFALHGHRLGRVDAHHPLLRETWRASPTSRPS